MKAVIFIGSSGKISFGKLSQALEYGALTVQIAGDFDDAMLRVKEVSKDLGIYLVNSINPFRLEGPEVSDVRVLEALRWNHLIGLLCLAVILVIRVRLVKRLLNCINWV